MFAATDTTSFTLVMMMLYLKRYPEWFVELQKEQRRLMEEFGDTLDRRVCHWLSVIQCMCSMH
jgi:cytochrome P450